MPLFANKPWEEEGRIFTIGFVKMYCRALGVTIRVSQEWNEIIINLPRPYGTEGIAAHLDRGHTPETLQEAYKEAMATAFKMMQVHLNTQGTQASPGSSRGAQVWAQTNPCREIILPDQDALTEGSHRVYLQGGQRMDHNSWERLLNQTPSRGV